jgi:hypothetical protein
MKFIPTVIAIIACFSSANAQFPETWQGDWTGTLDIFNGSGKVQSVEMTVEIHKIDTSTQGRYISDWFTAPEIKTGAPTDSCRCRLKQASGRWMKRTLA